MAKNINGVIVSAFVCCGKTYLGEHYSTVLDLESTPYNYILTEEQKLLDNEQLKGTKKKKNPNFLKDYIAAIKDGIKKYDVVLVAPGGSIRKALQKNNLPYTLVYPEDSCKNEYIQRAKARGNNAAFIKRLQTEFVKDELKNDNYASHIIMKPGEYLEDALLREKLINRKDKI